MTNKIEKRIIVLLSAILLLSLLGLVVSLLWPPTISQAGPTLPPRQPGEATDAGADDDDDDGDHSKSPVGAYIELQVTGVSTGWTMVQWQDSAGNWHAVEGWQGPLPGNTRWWVAARDFGKGPFRWTVLKDQGGEMVGTSLAFTLPQKANETVRVSVTINP